jgi:hypothetical protein
MSGTVHATFTLTNSQEDGIFVLFKCPHPRTEGDSQQDLPVSDLRMQSSIPGQPEQVKNAWLWSGTLPPHGKVDLEISYQVASLVELTYRVLGKDGNQIKQTRVTFDRKDIDAVRFESADGLKAPSGESVVWERKDFLAPEFFSARVEETRNLFVSLVHLLEIGPVVCLLFLLTVSSVILARQPLTWVQLLTITAGYAVYFPLVLYLSANFSFMWALVIAAGVPGVLLINYARWLVGPRVGLFGGVFFLGLYQVFPTLAAFAGWNRGMVLLTLGVITLGVLINLQNRAFRARSIRPAVAIGLVLLTLTQYASFGAEVQVMLPGELVSYSAKQSPGTTNALVAFEPAQYRVTQEKGHFEVQAQIPFTVLRAGDQPVHLFGVPVHLKESRVEGNQSNFVHLVSLTNRVGLFAEGAGRGELRLSYRVPFLSHEGKTRALIPLVLAPSSNVELKSTQNDFEILTGTVWSIHQDTNGWAYDVGVAGEESLIIEWRQNGSGKSLALEKAGEGVKDFYGIGITRAQNLTIINSDSSCTHFAEFELPVSQSEEFRMSLPEKAKLISVSVNGVELNAPAIEDNVCKIHLPVRQAQQSAHRISFRIAYPPARLGFAGIIELSLPGLFQTVGTLEWVVALPNGFNTQVIASGLEKQKSIPNLERFGDYGRILSSHAHTFLAKDLAPPGAVSLTLKYQQIVAGIRDVAGD